jgi:hypothetical protein
MRYTLFLTENSALQKLAFSKDMFFLKKQVVILPVIHQFFHKTFRGV